MEIERSLVTDPSGDIHRLAILQRASRSHDRKPDQLPVAAEAKGMPLRGLVEVHSHRGVADVEVEDVRHMVVPDPVEGGAADGDGHEIL